MNTETVIQAILIVLGILSWLQCVLTALITIACFKNFEILQILREIFIPEPKIERTPGKDDKKPGEKPEQSFHERVVMVEEGKGAEKKVKKDESFK